MALNNLQRLIFRKTQQTKPSNAGEKLSANDGVKNSQKNEIIMRKPAFILENKTYKIIWDFLKIKWPNPGQN